MLNLEAIKTPEEQKRLIGDVTIVIPPKFGFDGVVEFQGKRWFARFYDPTFIPFDLKLGTSVKLRKIKGKRRLLIEPWPIEPSSVEPSSVKPSSLDIRFVSRFSFVSHQYMEHINNSRSWGKTTL